MDTIIPLCFPDYKADTDTFLGRQPLGHAGILIVDGRGLTNYFEYGRYDPAHKGLVHRVHIHNVMIINNAPEIRSLGLVLAQLSKGPPNKGSGQGGRIKGAYIQREGSFNRAQTFCLAQESLNTNPDRTPYSILHHSCATFVRDATRAAIPDMKIDDLTDFQPEAYLDDIIAAALKIGGSQLLASPPRFDVSLVN